MPAGGLPAAKGKLTLNNVDVDTNKTYHVFVTGKITQISPLNPANTETLTVYGISGVQKMTNVNTVYGLELVKFTDLNTNVAIPLYVVNPVSTQLEAYDGNGTLVATNTKIWLFDETKGLILVNEVSGLTATSGIADKAKKPKADKAIVGGNISLQWKATTSAPIIATELDPQS